MTPRSFWTILVKLLGVYVILQSLTPISQFVFNLYGLSSFGQEGEGNKFALINLSYLMAVIAIYLLLFYACVFKTDRVIDNLKLDKGFTDERFALNIHRSTILKIVVMVIGGVLIADSFPLFCQQLLGYFQQSNTFIYKKFTDSPVSKYIVYELLRTFIGFFMLTCSRMIVNYIELKRRKADAKDGIIIAK